MHSDFEKLENKPAPVFSKGKLLLGFSCESVSWQCFHFVCVRACVCWQTVVLDAPFVAEAFSSMYQMFIFLWTYFLWDTVEIKMKVEFVSRLGQSNFARSKEVGTRKGDICCDTVFTFSVCMPVDRFSARSRILRLLSVRLPTLVNVA